MTASLAAALGAVRARIARAAERAGRDPAAVRLVAVSKTVAAAGVRELVAAGHTLFGENRVQEALAKQAELGPGVEWHLIGRLQRNKVRHAVGAFALIHGVDDLPLAREIELRAAAAGLRQPVLVQVNLAGERTKSGTTTDEGLAALVREIGRLEHLELRGLMAIPPPVAAEQARPWFVRLRTLRDRLAGDAGLPLPELSMGMSDDFEVAVEEGATLVRVGRALFGERPA